MVFARDAVERLAVERLAVERLVLDDPALVFAAPALVFAREFDFAAAGAFRVTEVRSLSKSLSACLLVFAASRRSAASAEVLPQILTETTVLDAVGRAS